MRTLKWSRFQVGYEDKPDVFHRINTYEIDKKKGTADPVVGDKEFSLW